MIDILIAALLLGGTFFLFVGSLGVWRLPDLYCRMHAQTKAGTLGICGVLLAAALFFATADVAIKVLATIFFLYLTIPAGALMIARAGHRRGDALWHRTLRDDLAGHR